MTDGWHEDAIRFSHVTYRYPDAKTAALSKLSLSLPAGEVTVVAGASGTGKTTLLRCINGLVPHFSGGALSGEIRVLGLDPVHEGPQVMSRRVGFVFQDPETQFVMERVEDEIAFALENAALPAQEMRIRVEETLDLLDLAPLRNRRVATLSGGERQRVAIASALALRPHILVLDEPTSQLDPKSAEDVLYAAVRLNMDLGLTVVIAEHRLERVLPFADYLLYLPTSGGEPVLSDPRTVLNQVEIGIPLTRVARALGWEPLPLTIKEGRRFSRDWIRRQASKPRRVAAPEQISGRTHQEPYIRIRKMAAGYDEGPVVRDIDLELYRGEVVVLVGRNGSGKTTLLKSMVGLVRPRTGTILVDGRDTAGMDVAEICRQVGFLPQNPSRLLFADTVRDEFVITLQNHGLPADDRRIEALLERLGLLDYIDAYPRDLSVGERQRVAMAAILIPYPKAILLDEPTRGLDYGAKQRLIDLLHDWQRDGMAIAVVTHDVEFAAAIADRVVMLSQGEIIAEGDAQTILGASPLFAPQIARLFPSSGWLTPDDVLRASHLDGDGDEVFR